MMNRSPARKKSFGSLSGAKVSRRGSRGMMSNMDSHLQLGGVLDVGKNGKGRLDCGKHGVRDRAKLRIAKPDAIGAANRMHDRCRSEEHKSELQSLMRISYAVFCLKKKNKKQNKKN